MMAIHFDARRNLAVYSSFLLLIILVLYNLMRAGLELQANETLSTGGFVLFVLNLPVILVARLARKSGKSLLQDEYFWLFILMAASCLLGSLNVRLPILFISLGVVCFVYNAWGYFKSFNARETVSLLFILFFGCWFAMTIWDGDNLHPMLLERLSFDDRIHIDTIFHVSIAQMIKTYSIPTTGLNGLPFYHYHFGSHMVMAYVSSLLDINVFTFYQIGYPALFFPLFIKALLSLPILWSERITHQPSFKWNLWFGIVLAAGLVGVFPLYRVLARAGLDVSPLFTSESYGFSFFIVLMILNFTLFNYRFDEQDKSYHLPVVSMVILVLMIFFLGLTKNSSLFLFDVFIIYLFFRFRLYRQVKAWVYYVVIGAVSLVCLYLTFDHKAGDGSFAPFDFFERHIAMNPLFFVAVYFFWSFVLVAVCLALRYKMKMDGQHPPKYLRILIEGTVIVSVVGALPGVFFSIAGGSAHFFMNFQMWLSLSLLLMILPATGKEIMGLSGNIRWIKRPQVFRVGVMLVLLYAAVIVLYNFRKSAKTYTKHHLEDKKRICGEVPTTEKNTIFRNLNEVSSLNHRVAACLEKNETYAALQNLLSLDTIPLTRKAQTVLIWGDINVLTEMYPCYKYPFLFPALTGMAIKDGFVYEHCYGQNYSFEYYREVDAHRNPLPDAATMRQLVVDLEGGNVELSAKDG